MKLIWLAGLLLLASACEENVQSLNTLTDAEQDYIRGLSTAKCRNESQSSFDKMGDTSTEKILNLQRGDYWKIDRTGGSPSTTETTYIYVWNLVGNKLFLLIQEGTSPKRYSFLKLTKEFNEEVINAMIDHKCTKSTTVTFSQSSSTFSIKRKDITENEPPDYYKSDYTHSFSTAYPAIFMNYLVTQSKKKLKESGSSTVTSTTTYTGKVATTGEDFELEDFYTAYTNASFCIMDYTNVTDTYGTRKALAFPFTMSCSTNAATPPTNSGGDATLNFTPTTEL